MATPFNPFGRGRGAAQAVSADTAGRGRGSSSAQGSHFQSRGSRGRRASKWRGAAQGLGRGRGAGASDATDTPHLTTSAADTHQAVRTGSPFAQLNQQKASANSFGGQQTQRKSPSPAWHSGMANARATRGAARGAPRQNIQNQPLGTVVGNGPMQPVPVEDASILASYHERYEQVSKTSH